MGELTVNKVLGCLLAVALAVMGLRELSYQLFSPPGAHYDHHGEEEKSLNEKIAETYAYYVEVADGGAGVEEEEEVFDLGLALVSADVSRGERSFQAKCAICHSIEQGGANGTGPALWNSVGVAKASHAGFNYSGALSGMGGEWTYQNMNDWLYNPSGYVQGTSMAFAGLRRDDERANVIAYLAQMSENAPPFPEPVTGNAVEEASVEAVEDANVDVMDEAEAIADGVTETVDQTLEAVEDAVEDATDGEE